MREEHSSRTLDTRYVPHLPHSPSPTFFGFVRPKQLKHGPTSAKVLLFYIQNNIQNSSTYISFLIILFILLLFYFFILYMKFYSIYIIYLENSRHPNSWLPGVNGPKTPQTDDVKLSKPIPKSKENFGQFLIKLLC